MVIILLISNKQDFFFSVVETFHLLFSLTIEIYSGKM